MLRFCYGKGLEEEPQLQGRLKLALLVGPGGRVNWSQVRRSTLRSPKLEECIVSAITQHMAFGHPGGFAIVPVTVRLVLSR